MLHNVLLHFYSTPFTSQFRLLYFRINTFFLNDSPKLNTHLGGIKVKNILRGLSLLSPIAEERGTNGTQLSQVLPSSLVLFSCAPAVLSRVIIILFEMPISMIFCSFGCVCTSALTCALRLSSSLLFSVFFLSFLESYFIPKSL